MFKFPLDAYVLAIPLAYAGMAFAGLVLRVPTVDPETSNLAYYDDETTSGKQAQRYDNQFKQFFSARIRNHRLGVFQNWMDGSPQ